MEPLHSCGLGLLAHLAEAPVSFVKDLTDSVSVENDVATFECELSKPNKKVSWLKNGKPLKPSDKHEIVTEGPRHFLRIPKCELKDAGDFSVKVDGESAVSSAKLSVHGQCDIFTSLTFKTS